MSARTAWRLGALGLALACGGTARSEAPSLRPVALKRGLADRAWRDLWTTLRADSLGADGWDCRADLRPGAGRFAPATDGLHDWYASPSKETLCGRIRDAAEPGFKQTCGWLQRVFGSECDLNHYIVPDEPWRLLSTFYQCADAAAPRGPIAARQERPSADSTPCHAAAPVVEAEITPPLELRRFLQAGDPAARRTRGFEPWRQNSRWWQGDSSGRGEVLGGRLCAYGPWVLDSGHGNHPEIHPAQMIWWRGRDPSDVPGAADPLYLLLAQDASSRYAEPHHFRLEEAPIQRWAAWAQGPVEGYFRVAFSVPKPKDGQPTPVLRISDLRYGRDATRCPPAEQGVEGARPKPPVCARPYRLGGTTLFAVENYLGRPKCNRSRGGVDEDRPGATDCASIRVQGDSVFEVDDTYRGFLVVYARVGRPEEWREGFLSLKIEGAGLASEVAALGSAAEAAALGAQTRPRVEVTWEIPRRDRDPQRLVVDDAAAWEVFWREVGLDTALAPDAFRAWLGKQRKGSLRAARRVELRRHELAGGLASPDEAERPLAGQGRRPLEVRDVQVVDAADRGTPPQALGPGDGVIVEPRVWGLRLRFEPTSAPPRIERIEVTGEGLPETHAWRHAWFPTTAELNALLRELCVMRTLPSAARDTACSPEKRSSRRLPSDPRFVGAHLKDLFDHEREDGLSVDELRRLLSKVGEQCPRAALSAAE